MTGMIYSLATLAIVAIAGVAVKRWQTWRRTRRLNRSRPVRPERCSTCDVELKRVDEHELRAYPMDFDEAEFRTQGGGTYVSETYCVKHCPGACERGCTLVV